MRLLIMVLLAMGAFMWSYGQCQVPSHYTQIKIGSATVKATLALTNEDHRRGLQGVTHLDADEGKLFVFSNAQQLNFWMKDMRIPLDIIWLDEYKKIAHISENASVCKQTDCPLYPSKKPVRYVLEVNAGFAARHQLTAGMPVDFLV